MILEVDVGNTALKWRVIDALLQAVAEGVCAKEVDFLDRLRCQFDALSAVRISCVAKETISKALCERVLQLWGVSARLARTRKSFAGLTVAYSDPSRLGVDRWLAMLAAYKQAGRAVCVIDCGSAVTVDLVDDEGMHQGGYIVPGLAMQRSVLQQSTGQIRVEYEVEAGCHSWGGSTEEAVNFGVLRMVVSFIDAIVDEAMRGGIKPRCYMTGGDAGTLLPLIAHNEYFELRPQLVMDGLAIALS